MPPTKPISLPAGYAPAFAIGYSDAGGELAVVDSASPLPVSLPSDSPISVQQASPNTPPALQGTTAATLLAGPFEPAPGLPIVVTLSGIWEGVVQLERSSDSGATRHRLTAGGASWGRFTTNACEFVWEEHEENAELYLDITITSGSLSYRIAQ